MAFLSYKEIVELIDKVAESGIGAVEIESSGTRVRIEGTPSRDANGTTGGAVAAGHVEVQSLPVVQALPAESSQKVESEIPEVAGEDIDPSWHIVTSPIVGTFYSASNPEAGPFVRPGDRVAKGAVLCIIEAMKLMNEIESDCEGEVLEVLVENGQPVEFGEPLLRIRKAGSA